MDAKWLKMQFDLNPDMVKSDLAEQLGLEPPAISKILKGTRQIKAQEYAQMRAFFGFPSIEAGDPVYTSGYRLGELANGNAMEEEHVFAQEEDWVIPQKIINKRTSATADQIKIFENKEPLMAPEFALGAHVVVDLSDAQPSPPGVFVIYDGMGHMLRHCEFVANSSPQEITISAHCSNFTEQRLFLDDVTIVGRVIAKLQML